MLSLEVHGIIRYLTNSGVKFRVTDYDTPGIHSPTSYHYAEGTGGTGLAIDVAGLTPSYNSPQLLAIFSAFGPVESRLAELAYRGAPYNIKNGIRVAPYDKYDHVHVAVPKGTILAKEIPMEPVPPEHKKIIAAFPHEAGYVLVAADGAVYCFGCVYKGGLQWDGENWQLR